MTSNSKVFGIDAGNTLIKAALLDGDQVREVRRYTLSELAALQAWMQAEDNAPVVLSSVLSEEDTAHLLALSPKIVRITARSKLPFLSNYQSPTLGIDRLCNAAYSLAHMKTEHAVVVDIGTCLKFDLMHRKLGYLGGSISPGITLRYAALHTYTGKLPLLSNKSRAKLVGNTTEASLQSGVINGVEVEIQGMMDRYSRDFIDLTFFMTGGDAGLFEFHSKNNIFADENLTLKGLIEIYKHNA